MRGMVRNRWKKLYIRVWNKLHFDRRLEWALNHLRNGKSPGIDNIPIEVWKASGEEGILLLLKICKMVWEMKEWPRDWCRVIFVQKREIKKSVQIAGKLT